jgi:hypothetical protein
VNPYLGKHKNETTNFLQNELYLFYKSEVLEEMQVIKLLLSTALQQNFEESANSKADNLLVSYFLLTVPNQ